MTLENRVRLLSVSTAFFGMATCGLLGALLVSVRGESGSGTAKSETLVSKSPSSGAAPGGQSRTWIGAKGRPVTASDPVTGATFRLRWPYKEDPTDYDADHVTAYLRNRMLSLIEKSRASESPVDSLVQKRYEADYGPIELLPLEN